MSLFSVVIAQPYSSYLRTGLFIALFFTFLHLFTKLTWKIEKLIANFNLDGEWFNCHLVSFVAVVILSALFAQFVLTSILVIEDEEIPAPTYRNMTK
jgi:hypothetical protein